MGRLAEALRANLKSVAESDARALREMDQELKAATSGFVPSEAQLSGQVDAKALLGKGSFQQQTVQTLRRLCKENGITLTHRVAPRHNNIRNQKDRRQKQKQKK